MISTTQIDDLLARGGNVIDNNGEKIGSLGQIYLDDQTSEPTWATVNTGLFGLGESFVPLQGADVDGDDIRVSYSKDQVKDAPKVDPDGHLDPDEEARLYEYYGRGAEYTSYADHDVLGTDRDVVDTNRVVGDRDADRVRDVDTEAELTLAEERVNVGTERRETGKVRLRKYVVTENVTKTVPVEREEVRIERVPADGDEVGRLGEDVAEVTLHEEVPVIDKETVATEKVRLAKDTVTDQERVTTDVSHEELDTENLGADRTYVDGDVTDDKRGIIDRAKDALDRDNDGRIG